ncbi:MAG: hypothetical protein ACREVB_08025 [Burkholderiales bacterium]
MTGIGARVAMRMVADGVPDPIRSLPMFTAEGTAAIVFFGALAGAPFGALFAVAHDRLPGPDRARGLLFGVAMLVTLGPLFFTLGREEFLSYQRMVLFAFLFPLFGIAAGLAFEPSLRLARRLPGAARMAFVLIALGGGALLVASGIAPAIVQAVQTHGALAVAYLVPWLAVGALVGLALRSRISPAQLVRSPD